MKEYKAVNLYAGIGGNRKNWPKNIKVTAVELNPRVAEVYARYHPEDEIIVGDAHQHLLENYHLYDIAWDSFPCQSHSKMARVNHKRYNLRKYPDLGLYQEILYLKEFFKGKWVVENVNPYYKPLIPAVKLERHLFWSNFKITPFKMPQVDNFIDAKFDDIKKWLGYEDFNDRIYLGKNHDYTQILRNCVHPKLGRHILDCAINSLEAKEQKQSVLELI